MKSYLKILIIIIFIIISGKVYSQQTSSATCSFTVNGGQSLNGWKFWKGVTNYYSVNMQVLNLLPGERWALYVMRPNGTFAQIDGNQNLTNYTFQFHITANDPNYPSGSGYKFRLSPQGPPTNIWCESSIFYISDLPILNLTLNTSTPLTAGNNAQVSWSVTGGIPGLSNGGWTGNIRLQWYQNSTPLLNIGETPVSNGSYSFTVPCFSGNNYRIAGANADQGTSIPAGYVSDFTNNFFSINLPSAPNAPILSFPQNGAVLTDLTPDLAWTANGAIGFIGQVSTNPNFTTIVTENNNIQAFNWTPTLTLFGTYYWRIKSKGLCNVESNWSEIRSFTVSNAPVLVSPSNGSIINTNEINFQWSDCNALSYELYVDNNSGLGSPEVSKINIPELINYTSISYQLGGNWLEGNTYYWKVFAVYPGNVKVASALGQFTYAPQRTLTPTWVPIYRAYKSSAVDHFYCTSEDHLLTAMLNGYYFEKVEGYISLTPFNIGNDLKNIFRFYLARHDSHFYTTNPSVKDSLIIADTLNKYEGIIGYTYGTERSDLVKLYYAYLNASPQTQIDHFYTISDIERNNALNNGYIAKGFIAYVSPMGDEITEPWMEMQPEYGYGINAQNGNLGSYNKSSFDIPGARTSLSFMHIYNSYTTRLMSQTNPLGTGWTHSYMGSLSQYGGSFYVFWPGGGVHKYNVSDLKPVTKGVYDVLVKLTGTKYQITKKDQFVYTFDILNPGVDSTAFLTSIKDRNNNTFTCAYNTQERKLTTVTSPEGRILTFIYYTEQNKRHLIKEVRDPINRTIKFEYDNDNNLVKFTDAKNQVTQYIYDLTARFDHLLKRIIFPKGNFIENTYLNKRVINQQTNTGTILQIGYPSNTQRTITENGSTINAYYDPPNGLPLLSSLVLSSGNTTFEYNDNQNPIKPTKITDGRGYITTVSYDAKGNALQINKPENAVHKFIYNSFNDVTKYTDPRNKETNYGYNGFGNLTSVQTPRGTTNITYNSNGTINTITDPLNRTTTLSYNSFGNVTSIRNNLNHATSYGYDNISRVTSMTDANNRQTAYNYDNNDLITNILNPASGNISYSYDANDNANSISNPGNHITTFNYNNKDLLSNVTNPLSNQVSYEYFENGLLKSKTKPNGQVINYTYDNSNRLQSIGGAITGSLAYDNNDNITQAGNINGQITYIYDGLNRMTSSTDYYGNIVGYTYDQTNNIISITYPGNKVVTYTYYDDNLLQSVKDWNNNTTTYTYRSDGSLEQILYPNNTKKTFTYDGAGRIIGISNKLANGNIISEYTFTLDNVGNHLSVSQSEQFQNPVLNSTSKNLTYNSANRIINDGANSYSFDANGNLLQKSGSSTSNYGYDAENRLTNMSGEYSAGYSYDLFGNRRYSNINGNIKKYILDINNPLPRVLMETDNNGNVLNYYVYGLELISRIKPNNTTHYYHSDFRGSVIAITDASQTITHKYQYGAFGEILQRTELDANPFKYVGSFGVMEEGTGLYFMRARYYDAKIGRFISEDPIWDINLYPYADNSPMVKIDPKGLSTKEEEIYKLLTRIKMVMETLRKNKEFKSLKYLEYGYYLFRVTRFFYENIKLAFTNPYGKTTETAGTLLWDGLGLISKTLGNVQFYYSLGVDFVNMEKQAYKDAKFLWNYYRNR
ncbi:MAG: RHS repeat protein [Ignavibacteria bacterium]|nr:RHS repeat protein [Ignavibacteria bacterium]